MAIPPAHRRVIAQFVLTQAGGGGSEIAEFTLCGLSTGGFELDVATAVDAYLRSHVTGTLIGMSFLAGYQGTRCQAIDGAGMVSASAYASAGGPVYGANGSMTSTVTCSAITLVTGMRDSKGTLISGRFYPPAQPVGLAGATFTLSDTQNYVGAWATLLTGLYTAASMNPVVASSTSVGNAPVTGITADTVVDTQRRRRNGVTIQRSTAVAV